MVIDPRVVKQVESPPYPLLFATISGAHLYGFPSPDSDFDVRGVHVLPADDVLGLYQSEYERLRGVLEEASAASGLPEVATVKPALNDLLLRIRRTFGDGGTR